MADEVVFTGTADDNNTGDPLRQAMAKINQRFVVLAAGQSPDAQNIVVRVETARDEAEDAQAAAEAAQASALTAEAQAEAARDAAFTNANVFASTAAGLAAVALGQQFQVVSADGLSLLRYRHDAGPVATLVATAPAKAYVDAVDQKAGAVVAEFDLTDGVNLMNPSNALDGFYYFNATGALDALATSMVSGRIPVQEGVRYIVRQPSPERGVMVQVYCWNAAGAFLGLGVVSGANPVVAGMNVTSRLASGLGGVRELYFTVPAGSGVAFVGFNIFFNFAAHTTDDFNRVRNATMVARAGLWPQGVIPYNPYKVAKMPEVDQLGSAFDHVPRKNLFNPARSIDAVVASYDTGFTEGFSNGIWLGPQNVEPGNTYTLWSNSGVALNSARAIYCFDAGANFLGLGQAIGARPAMASPPTDIVWAGDNGSLTFTIPSGSAIRFVATMTTHYAHDAAEFSRVVAGMQMELGAVKTEFQLASNYGTYRLKAGALPPGYGQAGMQRSTALRVTRSGSDVYVLAPFSATQDLVQRISLQQAGSNVPDTVNFMGARLASVGAATAATAWGLGAAIAAQGDDATPLNYNGTYIGANHGAAIVREVTATAHGKAIADVGSEWTDATPRKWYLMRIVDANKLAFVSENLSTAPAWSFDTSIDGATLTHSSGATNTGAITVASSIQTQLWPSLQNQTRRVLLDGVTEVTADGEYTCDTLDVVNTYTIPNPAAVVDFVRAAVGGSVQPAFNDPAIAADLRRSITYRFAENGSVSVTDGVEALNTLNLNYAGVTQAGALTYTGKTLSQYVPRLNPIVGGVKTWNFSAVENIGGTTEQITFPAASWTDPANPPDRMAQIVSTGATREYGLMVGYSPLRGAGLPANRAAGLTTAGFVSAARKQYPYAIQGGTLAAGSFRELTAFRAFWSASACPQATACAWYRDGKNVIVVADFHETVSNARISLPVRFVGMDVAVVDKTASVTLRGDGIVSADGLVVSVSGGYGYIVARLS